VLIDPRGRTDFPALTGILGAMMALEVIREIIGFGEGLVGRLLLIDAFNMRFETVHYRWDPANPLNGVATAAPAVRVS
jgi:molybdopterin-synthase adenylyltransferase